jgi:hypothetical protein
VKADVVVLDHFAPAVRPRMNSIWIEPPASGSPVPVRGARQNVKLERWRTDSMLGAGLRSKDMLLDSAEVFSSAPGDIPVAESAEGPVIVARASSPKIVVMGFHPMRSAMKYELATPLLVANILRWMAPETFRRLEVQAGTVGTVTLPVDKGTDPATVRVLSENQKPLPFTIEGNALRFFAGAPGTVRVLMGDRELVYSLNLPDVAEAVWKAPPTVRHGIPRASEQGGSATDLWPWLALAGGLGLFIDWLLFGRSRAFRLRAARIVAKANWRTHWPISRKAS